MTDPVVPGEEGPDPAPDELRQRLLRTERHLAKWRRRQGVEAWRLYDHDLPQYPAVVDVFGGRAHIRDRGYDDEDSVLRLAQLSEAVQECLGLHRKAVYVERRHRQQSGEGRGPRANPVPILEDEDAPGFEVREAGRRFWIVFSDRLDPGLFLDHRGTRRWVAERSEGARVLNLFCYTASFSVYAATAGAAATTSVDLSRRTLIWARRNFELNGIEEDRHQLVRADCLVWLKEQARDRAARGSYDLIVLDPPTFSNSKGMRGAFDVQRDHPRMIRDAMKLLAPTGSMVFSTNRRRFALDEELGRQFLVRDLGRATTEKDFERNPGVHHAFHLRHRRDSSDAGQ